MTPNFSWKICFCISATLGEAERWLIAGPPLLPMDCLLGLRPDEGPLIFDFSALRNGEPGFNEGERGILMHFEVAGLTASRAFQLEGLLG